MRNIFIMMAFIFLAAGCVNVPTSTNDERLADYTPKITDQDLQFDPVSTPISEVYKTELKANPEQSAAYLIEDGLTSLFVRLGFARMATKTIELQTYIYSNDFSSFVLLRELKMAADRGVKVRILLDDYGTKSDIADVMLLNNHPNIEVKVFNVVPNRSNILYYPQMLLDFNRLNSRMHNKLFIVDNIAYVTGGRNIGSNYFYPETASNFSDTDVLFLGELTHDATNSFNEYWDYHLSIPASAFAHADKHETIEDTDARLLEILEKADYESEVYEKYINQVIDTNNNKKFKFYWGYGNFLADPPSKIEMTKEEKSEYSGDIVTGLQHLWQSVNESVYISAAYFVPGENATNQISLVEDRGIDMTVVTNSLSSTNATTVYAKWEKYRSDLINAGVEVYEFMEDAENLKSEDRESEQSSFSVLHSKSIVFDDEVAWIGSFNLDPRSAYYNTENVAIFRNDDFAKKVRDAIIKDTQTSWRVTIEDGDTVWTGKPQDSNDIEVHHRSPDTSIFRRIYKYISKMVPEKLV